MNYFLLIVLTTIASAIVGKFLDSTFLFALCGFILSAFIVAEINTYKINKIITDLKGGI